MILCFTTDSFDDKQINDCHLRFSQEQEQEQAVFVRAKLSSLASLIFFPLGSRFNYNKRLIATD